MSPIFKAPVCIGAECKPAESRVPVDPATAGHLRSIGVNISVQSSRQRTFPDDAYTAAEIPVVDSTAASKVVVAVKEFTHGKEVKQLHPGQVVLAFHHVHKGQPHNLQNLRDAIALGCSLWDYELYRPGGIQEVTTSFHAGFAGAANALIVWGQRKKALGEQSDFSAMPVPGQFGTENALVARMNGKPITEPVRVLIVGTGGCGQGAANLCSRLGLPRASTAEVLAGRPGPWYCVAETADVVTRLGGGTYAKEEYRAAGKEKYGNNYPAFLGKHDVLVFCPYWDDRFPALLSRDVFVEHRAELPAVISDVTCDIRGSLWCTHREATVDKPVISYDPDSDTVVDGLDPSLVVTTCVDNLPAQLAVSCSEVLSRSLSAVIRDMARLDTSQPLEHWEPQLDRDALADAFICYNGRLMPQYRHLESLL